MPNLQIQLQPSAFRVNLNRISQSEGGFGIISESKRNSVWILIKGRFSGVGSLLKIRLLNWNDGFEAQNSIPFSPIWR